MVEVIAGMTGAAAEIADIGIKGTGAATGLIVGKYLGKTLENLVVKPVTPTSPLSDKFLGFVVNNVPKGIGAYLTTKVKTASEPTNAFVAGIGYGFAADIVVDTIARATNQFAPTPFLGGSPAAEQRIQALLKENSEMKQSLQRLGVKPPVVRIEPVLKSEVAAPVKEREAKYQFAEIEKERKPAEERYQFAGPSGKDITAPEVLVTGFGFTRGE